MKFKHIVISYVLTWLVIIFFICLFEWRALSRFQLSYDEELYRQLIREEMQPAGAETTASPSETETEAVLNDYEIIVDETMQIFVNGRLFNPDKKEEINNKMYTDYYNLTGNNIQPYKCVVRASDISDIKVTDSNGNELEHVDYNYIASLYNSDEENKRLVLDKFEIYLNYLNGIVEWDDVMTVVRSGSKAYRALVNSQDALKWTVQSLSVVFGNETVTDFRMPDDTHIICNIEMDLTKNTVQGKVENEHVNYQVLYEKVNGSWYIYSFMTQ